MNQFFKSKFMKPIKLLEEIKNDFVKKFDNDPQVKRICTVMINEFKVRSKSLTKE